MDVTARHARTHRYSETRNADKLCMNIALEMIERMHQSAVRVSEQDRSEWTCRALSVKNNKYA